ncbi:MAG: hypothetical protein WBV25_11660 [Methylocella sp.]
MSNETGAVVIAEGTEYELLSSGDGAAFVLRFKTDQLTAHLQGDDAIRFRADYEALKMQYPAWQADQMLAQLWDQGGYSWLAEQDGC